MLAKVHTKLNIFVGWVHKGWNSSNIVFFKDGTLPSPSNRVDSSDEGSALDLARPWIFGFETSRHEEADSLLKADYTPAANAYRHPDRWGQTWGQPNEKIERFRKAHDVYALVSRNVTMRMSAHCA